MANEAFTVVQTTDPNDDVGPAMSSATVVPRPDVICQTGLAKGLVRTASQRSSRLLKNYFEGSRRATLIQEAGWRRTIDSVLTAA